METVELESLELRLSASFDSEFLAKDAERVLRVDFPREIERRGTWENSVGESGRGV